jgi:glutamate N-acetyltransferase/amino-acid N-acetyltransferase
LHDALELVAVQLAQAIVRDGEGTKTITIVVDGGRDDGECDRSRARSPIRRWSNSVASDPNLGRLCAIGNAAIEDLDPRACRSGSTTCWSSRMAAALRPIARKTASE